MNPIGVVHSAKFRTLVPGAMRLVLVASKSTETYSELGLEKTTVAFVTLVGTYSCSILPLRTSSYHPIKLGFTSRNSSRSVTFKKSSSARAEVIVTINNNVYAKIYAKTPPKPFFCQNQKRPSTSMVKTWYKLRKTWYNHVAVK